jgi:hypothetical protein
MRPPASLAALAAALLVGCSFAFEDGATAIAYDIESHVSRAARNGAATLLHRTSPRRGGCADAYRVQFSRESALVIWCHAPDSTAQVVSSHITTYHLRLVEVPETTIVDKARGEPLIIEIESGPGKAVVRRVR